MLRLTTSNLEKFLLLALLVAISGANRRQDENSSCPADEKEPWTYRGSNGPNHWSETYPTCNGQSQSPINIDTSTVERDADLAGLDFTNYDVPVSEATMENNGHTIEVTPQDDVDRTISVDGETYKLAQFHFHFGCKPGRGSEHTINNASQSMELHLVHMTDDEKIAVVGVLMHERNQTPNRELMKIVRQLGEVKYKDTETELKSRLNLRKLLPANIKSFYRYMGSLTTPPCTEGVIWSVMTDPTPVGSQQMKRFRELKSATKEDDAPGCKLCDNYRPVQPLGDRQVTLSANGRRKDG